MLANIGTDIHKGYRSSLKFIYTIFVIKTNINKVIRETFFYRGKNIDFFPFNLNDFGSSNLEVPA